MATILILEDEVDVRELFALILGQHSHTVLEASTAEEAKRVSTENRVDALVTNVILPGGKSGTDFALELLRSQPHVRVLIVSGWPVQRTDDRENISKMPEGSYLILQKPFGIDMLVRKVRDLIGKTERTA